MNIEIERRFLTSDFSWRDKARMKQTSRIVQGYPFSRQERGKAVRIRQVTSFTGKIKYIYGEKSEGTGLITPEMERRVSSDEGLTLLEECGDRILKKIRWEVSLGNGLIVHIDEFMTIRERPTNLVISEVEFETVEEAETFEPPTWLGQEVTGELAWSNFCLCVNGLPKL